jgi:hypothetical protein
MPNLGLSRADCGHVLPNVLANALAIVSLHYRCASISVALLVCADIYLVAILIEAALRSSGRPAGPVLFDLPERTWSLLQLLLMVTLVVTAFGSLYRTSGGVIHVTKDLPSSTTAVLLPTAGENASPLASSTEALYFSAVTLTTVGYGDYVPGNDDARRLVVWELGTGLLLIAGGLTLVISRLAVFPDG